MKKYSLPIVISVIVAFLFATIYTYASTTISTNISTGGTLTVGGNSTMGGSNTFGDAATDVNLFTGTLQATTTALFTAGATMYNTLTLYNSAAAGTVNEGGIYYDTASSVIKLYDGTAWHTVGTSTDGFTLATNKVHLSDVPHYYMTVGTTTQVGLSVLTLTATTTDSIPLTIKGVSGQTAKFLQIQDFIGTERFGIDQNGWINMGVGSGLTSIGKNMTIGTTTQSGLSVLTLEATSTAAIPLTLRGYTGQTANLFQVHDVAGTELFAIDKGGNSTIPYASSTAITASAGVWVGGSATTTSDGNFQTSGAVTVGGSGTAVNSIVHGLCTLAQTTITASSTVGIPCTSATGITTDHKVFVTATTTLNRGFIIETASSSAADTIGLYIYNSNSIGTTSTSIVDNIYINFFGIK